MDLIGREESELEYQARVLERAGRRELPVLERIRFLAIFTTLSDEMFRVRVAALGRTADDEPAAGAPAAATPGERATSPRPPSERVRALLARFGELATRQREIFADEVEPDLAEAGIHLRSWSELHDDHRAHLSAEFVREIEPILTPLAVGPAHPFPFISDLSVSIGAILDDGYESRFGRVKVPASVARFRVVTTDDDEIVVVPVEEVIGAHLDGIFPGRSVREWGSFRVTRDADYEVDDDEVEDLLDAIASELAVRRFQDAVRLEIDHDVSDQMRSLLVDELGLATEACFRRHRPIGLGDLWELHALDRPDLKDPVPTPAVPRALANGGDGTLRRAGGSSEVFDVIRAGDVLVQHPYESFGASTQRFLHDAAEDDAVQAIKQTLYRTSGDSPIAASLMRAVELGKQVAVLVELKARFDEEANIRWAEQMESRGVHVVYGFVDIKTHTKTALVVRADPDGEIRRYGHIGTGNYNPDTALHYEDLGLLTADPVLTADLAELFNMLTSHSRDGTFQRLLVAPVNLLGTVLELIEAQAHPGGRIVIKVNNLTHVGVIEALCAASQAGCEIDLVVRSTCRLRPGVPGVSEGIRVRSIVGPVLEHSRILRFGAPGYDQRYYIGSADLMDRNLENRVEAVAPIDDPDLRARLDDVLERCLADTELAWTLGADGRWTPCSEPSGGSGGDGGPGERCDVQRELRDLARSSAERA
ncbi:polyphosphate kinase 1 [Ilumatobacter sp.]|uniref:polyphosphate kinase 1 n=1 Tax=Ilumatobacter sp. TaxID=1967498 RepID=UPI003B52EF48